MTTAQEEIKQIRRELVETGADPFQVAAIALAEVRRYRQLLKELNQQVLERRQAR
jgi:hypothetical protein